MALNLDDVYTFPTCTWSISEESHLIESLHRRIPTLNFTDRMAVNNALRPISRDIVKESGVRPSKSGFEIMQKILNLWSRLHLFEAFIGLPGITYIANEERVIVGDQYKLAIPAMEEPPLFRFFRMHALPHVSKLRAIFFEARMIALDFTWVLEAQLANDRGKIPLLPNY